MSDIDTMLEMLAKTGQPYERKTVDPITVIETAGVSMWFLEPMGNLYAISNDEGPADPEVEPIDPSGEREPTPAMSNKEAEALRRELEEEAFFAEKQAKPPTIAEKLREIGIIVNPGSRDG